MKSTFRFFTLLVLAISLFACQQKEMFDQGALSGQPMKTVTINAGIEGVDTKASLDSESGAFTWQSGDAISVLATDGKFYDFTLVKGEDSNAAAFEGSIPEDAEITTVATYPRIVANATSSEGVLSENTLNYALPAEWTYAKEVSNVPMVATFGPGAEEIAFKQVGGVMRFPISNLPANSTIVFTMNDKTITGTFPVDITALGETAMVAGAEASEVVVKYTSEYPALQSVINLPVPTGVYNNFTVTVKNADNEEIYTKGYTAENTVERATLLNMTEIVLSELPMAVAEVWPFFVDARVILTLNCEPGEKVAAYIDGATEPVLVDVEDWGDKTAIVIGGNFAHNTKHTVAVAKVVNGVVVPESKSEAVEFTTADIRQLTNNTGTKFVAVGWDDITIANAPVWDPVKKRYSLIPFENNQDKRGYQVQLYAADKTTVLYDLYPFDGHNWFEGAFCGEVNFGKVGGVNAASPTALTFCWLEPGKDYYFRVKALDETVYLDNTNGNYNPDGAADPTKPVPYPLCSERGGSAWSDFVKLSTDPAHVPSANEVLYEGFDDLLIHMDLANWSHVVVPDFTPEYGSMSKDDYNATLAEGYKAFFKNPDIANTKFFVQQYGSEFTAEKYGMFDEAYVSGEPRYFNEYAGGLKGWSHSSSRNKSGDQLRPAVGIAYMGRGATYKDSAPLYTPAINSAKLDRNVATKCIVTVNVTPWLGSSVDFNTALKSLKVSVIRGSNITESKTASIYDSNPGKWDDAIKYTSGSDYVRYFPFFELQFEVYLKYGDKLCFDRAVASEKGSIGFDDIKVEVVPGDYEGVNPADSGVGTAPDDTNYDVYGLGEFPITYWYTVEPSSYMNPDGTYNDELTKQRYQQVKDAGINIAMYYGHSLDLSISEQKRLLGILEELGLYYIGSAVSSHGAIPTDEQIAEIKQHLYPSPYYLGDLVRDEPSATEFDNLGQYVERFRREMPDKDVYINLFPNYASSSRLGTSTYEEHIDQYIAKVPTKAISYDYYGLLPNGSLNPTYFNNADLVRSKSLAVRKPFWVITQAGLVTGMRYPDEQEQRWSVLSNIALGSKGISYFCYWTPSQDPNAAPEDQLGIYMITNDGQKTEMYDWVKKINADIKTIGKKLLYCHADGAIMTATAGYPLFDNGGAGRTKYGPVLGVSNEGGNHVLCGCFRDARVSENGDNYKGYKVMVMSEYYAHKTINAFLDIANTVNEITVTHNNTTQTIALTNTTDVKVGDIKVKFNGATLTLNIPGGEAALIEF